jgi:hypothetical protein
MNSVLWNQIHLKGRMKKAVIHKVILNNIKKGQMSII